MHVEAVTAGRETAANHLAYTHLYMFLVAAITMEQRYNLMKNGECIGTYNGFQVEMLYMEWA